MRFLRDKTQERRMERAISFVKNNNLTYLSKEELSSIAHEIRCLETNKTLGILIEVGCALGGSSIVMAASKKRKRKLLVFDTFEGIPTPTSRDGDDVWTRYRTIASGSSPGIGKDIYYGYRENLFEHVRANFSNAGLSPEANNIQLIRGIIQETLKLNETVALAHIDADWYESVKCALHSISPFMTVGGRFIIDDYDVWSGCRDAVSEFIASEDRFVLERNQKVHLIRVKP